MERREFLKYCAATAAKLGLTATFAEALMIPSASGAPVGVDSLKRTLSPVDGLVLVPGDRKFNQYLGSFNKRTQLTPSVRVMCQTPEAVTQALQWAGLNSVPLAMRSGGHSYEGFSQTTGLVIDTRPMSQTDISQDSRSIWVGAGAGLGEVYKVVGARGVVVPAGSCPTVGVTGHTTGGGYGLLARPFGLACDSLLELEMVLANGQKVTANETENSDLFWACRGAGGGSFGVITKLLFRTHDCTSVSVFGITWELSKDQAKTLMQIWQAWAPEAPAGINSLMKVSKLENGAIRVRVSGQSVGSSSSLRTELANLTSQFKVKSESIKRLSFLDAVNHFGGAETTYPSIYMKGKSDYLKQTMSSAAIDTFLTNLPVKKIAAIFDSYGGAIRQKSDSDTAFAHREKTISSIQYYMEWDDPKETNSRTALMRSFYDSIRADMSGGAYVNYCDLDLPNYAEAYWVGNLDRLISIKNAYDPKNVFKHAQSVPLRR